MSLSETASVDLSWRLSTFTRVADLSAFIAFGAVLIGGAVVAGWDGLAFLVLVPVAMWLCWRLVLQPHITLTQNAVIVQNPYTRRKADYSDIAGVDVRPDSRFPLAIRVNSGSDITPWCVQGGPLTARRAQRRADQIATAIRARLPA